jgi:hypothetical protein
MFLAHHDKIIFMIRAIARQRSCVKFTKLQGEKEKIHRATVTVTVKFSLRA